METIERRKDKRAKNYGDNKGKKKEIKQEGLELREWTEEDDNEMGNICDLYYEL